MKRVLLPFLFAVVTAGCGLAEGELNTNDSTEFGDEVVESELGMHQQSWVLARRDFRKCASPYCGGWFVHDVNRQNLNEKYVSAFDFTGSGLSDEDQSRVTGAGTNELVLKGKLGAIDSKTNTRMFIVAEAYRGMPGATFKTDDVFYVAQQKNPQINCFTAPCNNEEAKKLNYAPWTSFTSYDTSRIAAARLDHAWLDSRVQLHGAVVAGKLRNGSQFPGGYEKVLDASQVFVRIPDNVGPCMMKPELSCGDSLTSSYSRTADRCLVQNACVPFGVCAYYIPSCDDGYSLISWRGGPVACPQYACDPSFVVYE